MRETDGSASTLTSKTPFPNNYAREVIEFSRGRGVWLQDRSGRKYLDLGAGIAVNALGYGNRELARVVARQMRKLVHVSNLHTTTPSLELGARLLDLASSVGREPFAAVHFGNSGAEANESAIKYARLWSYMEKGPGHHRIICFENAFHGRTMGALSATPKEAYRRKFEPLVPGFDFVPWNDPVALEEAVGEDVAAIMVEPVQGEGGLKVLSPEMAETLNRICRERRVLIICDEVQTGLGRLGTLFGSTLSGLKPDIITLSKPLAGGLPLSATLIPAAINDRLEVGDHGTTFGGGPVTSAAALYVLDRITAPSFLEHVRERAAELDAGLRRLRERYEWITGLPGTGMLRGMEIDLGPDQETILPGIVPAARDQGLLILRSGSNVIRLAPPLVISPRELTQGLGILDTVYQTINARRQS
ncbi:MAG: aminotransferase class III-fold pyridoxal phosphate-dependent enzyme [Spirochaetaceae bacterium]|nr:MAG: aminotransferase class III-fold pyridoxal phosphate-dependent enzyme [Spirochaetaceae bacterium]